MVKVERKLNGHTYDVCVWSDGQYVKVTESVSMQEAWRVKTALDGMARAVRNNAQCRERMRHYIT